MVGQIQPMDHSLLIPDFGYQWLSNQQPFLIIRGNFYLLWRNIGRKTTEVPEILWNVHRGMFTEICKQK